MSATVHWSICSHELACPTLFFPPCQLERQYHTLAAVLSKTWLLVHLCLTPGRLLPLSISNFAVILSIGMRFFHGDSTESGLMMCEQLAAASKAILQHIGRPPFILSLYNLWVSVSQCLAVFERTIFPEQEVQTSTSLVTPPRLRPLSAVMEDSFQEFAPLILAAIQNLNTLELFEEDESVFPKQTNFCLVKLLTTSKKGCTTALFYSLQE